LLCYFSIQYFCFEKVSPFCKDETINIPKILPLRGKKIIKKIG